MKKTLQHLDFLIVHTQTIMSHYNKEEMARIPYFCLGLLERLHSSAVGLRLLVENIEKAPELEYSAGLIARTTILDFLFALRAYHIQTSNVESGKAAEDSKAELKEYCNEVLADGLKQTFQYLSDVHVEGGLTQDELNERYRNLSNQYSAFLEPYQEDGKPPVVRFKSPSSARQLYKLLLSHATLKPLARNYDTYSYYSKYEHFGILSYVLKRRLSKEQQTALINALELFVLHDFIICSLMKDYLPDDEFIKEKYRYVGEYIHKEVFV
jgi:hypothetical protein